MNKGTGKRNCLVLLWLLVFFWSVGSVPLKAADREGDDCKKDLHQYEVELVTPAEEGKEGLRRYVCQLCGDSYEEEIPRYGHIWSEWVVEQEATCSTEGRSYRYCVRCSRGEGEEERILPQTEHEYGVWQEERKATKEVEGLWTRSCIYDCGEVEMKVIPRLTGTKAGRGPEVVEAAGWLQGGSYRLDAAVVGGSVLVLFIYGGLILSDLAVLLWYRKIKQEVRLRRKEDLAGSGM